MIKLWKEELYCIIQPALMCRVKLAILLYLLLQSPHLCTHPSGQTESYMTKGGRKKKNF